MQWKLLWEFFVPKPLRPLGMGKWLLYFSWFSFTPVLFFITKNYWYSSSLYGVWRFFVRMMNISGPTEVTFIQMNPRKEMWYLINARVLVGNLILPFANYSMSVAILRRGVQSLVADVVIKDRFTDVSARGMTVVSL